jgi:hypothetical protein
MSFILISEKFMLLINLLAIIILGARMGVVV